MKKENKYIIMINRYGEYFVKNEINTGAIVTTEDPLSAYSDSDLEVIKQKVEHFKDRGVRCEIYKLVTTYTLSRVE
jgi:hypothetical protein